MSNMFWYALLGMISIVMAVYTFKKTEFRIHLAVYIFTMGLAFFMEYIVLILFNAYSFYPLVLHDRWYDNTVGSSLSQALFIPSFLMVLNAFRFNISGILFALFCVFLIEEFFIWKELYAHIWWHSSYTILILFVSIFVLKAWQKMLINRSPAAEFVTMYMAITTSMQGITIFVQAFLETYGYSIGWFNTPSRDSIAFNTAYWIIYSLLLAAILQYLFSYLTLSLLLIGDFILNYYLYKLGVLYVDQFWHIAVLSIVLISVLLMIRKLKSYLFPADVKV